MRLPETYFTRQTDLKIDGIPAILWGEPSDKLFIAVHGNISRKDDEVIVILAYEAIERGYQVLFDLPEHRDRIDEHFFHTEQHLSYFRQWLKDNIVTF